MQSAKSAEAPRYAAGLYREAQRLLRAGNLETARQNGRLFLLRDYDAADSLLNEAIRTAQAATTQAKANLSQIRLRAEQEVSGLGTELASWHEALDNSLLAFTAREHLTSSELALEAGKKLLARDEFDEAAEAAAKGRATLLELSNVIAAHNDDQNQKMRVWKRWLNETIAESRNSNSYALVVNKTAHKLYLVNSGKVVRSYDCELGYNSATQKYFSGDGATPEGQYRITEVKSNGSKYHKALMLNYPNDLDKRRFAQNKSKGIISRNARIGALIEIHGEGGRDKDWTNGCVALRNDDMDHLMGFVSVGTPVVIIRRAERWP